MKLVHFSLEEQIDFSKYQNYVFAVENPEWFFKYTKDLFNQSSGEDGEFVLSENTEILKFEKYSLFLYDYLNFDINTKKVLGEISNLVLAEFKQGDYISQIYDINQKIASLSSKVIENFDLPIVFDNDFSFEKLIKVANFRFEESTNLLDKITSYVDIFSKLKKLRLVIFVNLSSVFSIKKMEMLKKDINYKDVNILFIENHPITLKDSKTIVIDKDLCEI